MRKMIATMIIVILIIVTYMYAGNVFENTNGFNEQTNIIDSNKLVQELNNDYERIIGEIKDLQVTPDQVIKFNNIVAKHLYGGNVTEEEIALLVDVQRLLFDDKLLEKNPIGVHLERVKEEIIKYKEKDIKIIGYKNLAPEYIGYSKDSAIIKVVFYLNTSTKGEIYQEYLLKENEEGNWYIQGWAETEEFKVVGE